MRIHLLLLLTVTLLLLAVAGAAASTSQLQLQSSASSSQSSSPSSSSSYSPSSGSDNETSRPARKTHKDDFYVDGAGIPGISSVVGDLGPSYAGNIYTSPESNNTLFFWLWPQKANETTLKDEDNLVIWFNGGPGCSSLIGLFGENGPFSLKPNQDRRSVPTLNPFSWHRISDIVWVEQPPGTGFSTGPIVNTNDVQNGLLFTSWLHSFMSIFPEYKNRTITLIGESYAGYYVTYMYDALSNDGGFKMGGVGFVDALLAREDLYQTAAVWPWYQENKGILGVTPVWEKLVRPSLDRLGFTEQWSRDALAFPPKEHVRIPKAFDDGQELKDSEAELFDVWEDLVRQMRYVNPCLSVYAVQEKCPEYWDPLANGAVITHSFIEDTPDFKSYIHAPLDVHWSECSDVAVYARSNNTNDYTPRLGSTPFMENLLHNVTSHNKALIIHGKLDALLMYHGALMALQNYTWQGVQGFQSEPQTELVVDGQKQGILHSERNLTFALVDDCGHECPRFNPTTTFQLVRYLLGKVKYDDLVKPAK